MKKYLLSIFLVVNFLYGVDAELEILKKVTNIPSVSVKKSIDCDDKKLCRDIENLITKDLEVSGHFKTINTKYTLPLDTTPNMVTLKRENIDLYVTFNVKKEGKALNVSLKMYDINSRNLVINKTYTTSKASRFPFLVHRVAIDINAHLNAPSIDWMNRFVIFSKYTGVKQSEIVIADYTLTFQQTIIRGGFNIFPKWAGDEQEEFFFTSYVNSVPTLYKANIYTGKRKRILKSDGMIVASDVSKDGNKVLVTMSPNSQPDIYEYNLKTKRKKRITRYKGIDVGGSYVDNDTRVVFVSDRLKKPNIFAKSINGKGVERMVYHGRNNSSCTTYNDMIIYSSRDTSSEFGFNTFNLYMISTKSSFIKKLTSSGINQFAKFSSNGESVLFIKKDKGKSYLGIIRLSYDRTYLFPLKVGKLQSIDW